MYRILFLFTTAQLVALLCFSQQARYTSRQIDSLNTMREITHVKEQFKINEIQERQLFITGMQMAAEKRRVYREYWKTAEFHRQMERVDIVKDSLFNKVLGKGGYQAFIDKSQYQQGLKTQALRRSQKQAKDSAVAQPVRQ